MYRVEFKRVGPKKQSWTAHLKDYGPRSVIAHLAKRGLELPVESEDSFYPQSPGDDGAVEYVISVAGKILGRYTAFPLTKQAAALVAASDAIFGDAYFCEEFESCNEA